MFPFFSPHTCGIFFENGGNWFAALTNIHHFESTNLFVGNDQVIDIFTSEGMENILLCIFSFLLSTI